MGSLCFARVSNEESLEGESKGEGQAAPSDVPATGFLPIVVSPQASSPIEIAFPCGATVRVHHDADLRLMQHVATGLL
jgi:hypothetical protein